ncbi:MAG: hypothetical protein R2724_03045 [Bryobacterales bacterium]
MAELLQEHGAVDARLALAHLAAVVLERHAAARTERIDDLLERFDGPDEDLRQRRDVVQTVSLSQRFGVFSGQAGIVAARRAARRRPPRRSR